MPDAIGSCVGGRQSTLTMRLPRARLSKSESVVGEPPGGGVANLRWESGPREFVLAQSEMQEGIFPLVQIPPFGAGIFNAPDVRLSIRCL